MTRTLIIVSTLALLAACTKPHPASDADATNQAATSSAVTADDTSAAAPAPVAAAPAGQVTAADFVQKAAVGDMFEIQSSKIALARSGDKAVKDFAQMMIRDHTKTTAALKAAIKSSGQTLALPAALPDDKQAALADLKSVDARAFDKKFMDDQVDGHQQALDLMTGYAGAGDVADLKTFAAATAPMVQHHLDAAKAIIAGLK